MRLSSHALPCFSGPFCVRRFLPPDRVKVQLPAEGALMAEAPDVNQASEALIKILNDPEEPRRADRASEKAMQKPNSGVRDRVHDGQFRHPPPPTERGRRMFPCRPDGVFVIRVGEYTRALADEIGVVLDRSRSFTQRASADCCEVTFRSNGTGCRRFSCKWRSSWWRPMPRFWPHRYVARLIYPKMSVRARYGGGLMRTPVSCW